MFGNIIAKPVMMRSHMRGCTSVCIPINTCIQFQWAQKVRRVKKAKTGMTSRLREKWDNLRDS